MRLVITCLVLLVSTSAFGAEKRNPYLRLLERTQRLKAAFSKGPSLFNQPALRVPALVRTHDPKLTSAAVRSAGGHAGRPIGAFLPVLAEVDTLNLISQRAEVIRVEVSPPKRISLDISSLDVKVDQAQAGSGLPYPITGKGAIAALVDTGIDYNHEDFGGQRGRVLAIWDQFAASGDPPEGQTVGALCDRSRLLKGTCDSIDLVGHGTHVAATMAGSGDKYRGMAPEADILAVASIDFGLLVESVQWLFEQGQERGKPVVVNLSLGGHYGPHDGTSAESQALSSLTGPGKIIVAAAGNEGSDFIHLGYDPGGQTGKTVFYVFSGMDVSAALFTIWHSTTADLEFAIGVQKNWDEVTETDFVRSDGTSGQFDLSHAATSLGRVYFEPAGTANPDNAKMQLDIVVEPSEHAYADNQGLYNWYIKVKGNGLFDTWSAASGFFTPPARFSNQDQNGLTPGDNAKTIGMPAAAIDIIAVASYTTRASWLDDEGIERTRPGAVEGNISVFSSRGPSANPEQTGHKPAVAAPGEVIMAAMSKSSAELSEGTQVDSTHIGMQGTSMACPHVAGIVALLLQIDPDLDPTGIKRILTLTARADEFTSNQLPDHTFGYGKVDAFEAVAMAVGVGVCESDADCSEDYQCSAENRCQADQSGGCGCGTKGSGRVLLILPMLGLVFLQAYKVRRRLNCQS
ncbi:MAG: S8 family serine peptidase [Deltaproteobacteria bacterium]|nr:S8 family serine peptidase [Deltaproteobacteria bacterium]